MMNSFAPWIQAKVNDTMGTKIGVLSLSEIRDNQPMWAYYAAEHTGFLIGFDSTHAYFNAQRSESDEFNYLRQVDYREGRPAKPMLELDGVDMFLVKSNQWSYEKEWRILRPLQYADKIIEEDLYPICLFKYPPDAVSEVVFGYKIKNELLSSILSILGLEHFKHVQILKAEIGDTGYFSFRRIRG